MKKACRFFYTYVEIYTISGYADRLPEKVKHIIPMHYGTFDLSDEPLGKPIEVLLAHAENERVLPLKHGEVLLKD